MQLCFSYMKLLIISMLIAVHLKQKGYNIESTNHRHFQYKGYIEGLQNQPWWRTTGARQEVPVALAAKTQMPNMVSRYSDHCLIWKVMRRESHNNPTDPPPSPRVPEEGSHTADWWQAETGWPSQLIDAPVHTPDWQVVALKHMLSGGGGGEKLENLRKKKKENSKSKGTKTTLLSMLRNGEVKGQFEIPNKAKDFWGHQPQQRPPFSKVVWIKLVKVSEEES